MSKLRFGSPGEWGLFFLPVSIRLSFVIIDITSLWDLEEEWWTCRYQYIVPMGQMKEDEP